MVNNARGRTADRDSFPSSSRGHRVDAHLSHSFFSYPFKLLPHSSAHLLQVMHCVVFRFYWLKVRSLAESHNWLELDKFSKARKSNWIRGMFIDKVFRNLPSDVTFFWEEGPPDRKLRFPETGNGFVLELWGIRRHLGTLRNTPTEHLPEPGSR